MEYKKPTLLKKEPPKPRGGGGNGGVDSGCGMCKVFKNA